METLIRYHVLLGMIWVFTVYLYPTKRMVGLCGLISLYENISAKCRKSWHVIFFLGYFFLRTLDCLVYSYYKCISVFIFRAIVNELQPTFMCFLCCFYLKKPHRKFVLFCWKVKLFICFTKRCLANKRSSPRTYIGGGGGVNLGSVSSHDAYKMDFLDAFLPRNYFIFYRNNIVLGIKL